MSPESFGDFGELDAESFGVVDHLTPIDPDNLPTAPGDGHIVDPDLHIDGAAGRRQMTGHDEDTARADVTADAREENAFILALDGESLLDTSIEASLDRFARCCRLH